jgi:hypothetical protein
MAELDEKRRKQCVDILLSGVLEIKEEVSDVCRTRANDAVKILDDR